MISTGTQHDVQADIEIWLATKLMADPATAQQISQLLLTKSMFLKSRLAMKGRAPLIAARQILAAATVIRTQSEEKHGAGAALPNWPEISPAANEGKRAMPRVLMDVSDAWIVRFKHTIPATIDTLKSLEYQIIHAGYEGDIEPSSLLDQMHSQIVDLRRNLEALRIIF